MEVCYSGGKDSDVILQLAKEAGIPYRAIYKNTTIDPPGTIRHAKEMGVEVVQPKKTFFQLIREIGIPKRQSRFCCFYLKEYKILDRAIVGIRRSESWKRAKRYKEPEQCRIYRKNEKARQYLPILEWTDKDVAEFIADRDIKCHPLYYDEKGNFHVERRLGCLGCPLQSRKKRIEEFSKYPKMTRAWIKASIKNWESHPNAKWKKYFRDGYERFVMDVFYDSLRDFNQAVEGGMFGRIDCKKFLEDYFKIEL